MLSDLDVAWNPKPEGGAVAFALALDTDAAATLLDNGATDGETETGALNEVVQLDETVEDAGLLL